MCGRYQLNAKGRRLQKAFRVEVPEDLFPRFNIAPSEMAPVIREQEAGRSLYTVRWGLHALL